MTINETHQEQGIAWEVPKDGTFKEADPINQLLFATLHVHYHILIYKYENIL